MKILGLIPARGGSKGVPRKNIKPLKKRPLIAYSISSAIECKLIDRVVVSTDDREIADVSRAAGAEVPFIRPEELSTDEAPSIGLVIHALQYFINQGIEYDAVCLLQPTVPFRSVKDLDAAIDRFIKGDYDSLISVRAVPHIYNPYWTFREDTATETIHKVIDQSAIVARRQDLPNIYHRDGSVYLTKSEVILDKQSLYGDSIGHYIMSSSLDVNIDTMADWQVAERAQFENNDENDPTTNE